MNCCCLFIDALVLSNHISPRFVLSNNRQTAIPSYLESEAFFLLNSLLLPRVAEIANERLKFLISLLVDLRQV